MWQEVYVNESCIRRLMAGYQAHKEYIWHFTCVSCNGYWSISTMDEWVPKTMFCPHCGKKQENDKFWKHYCNIQKDVMSFEKDTECDWCGAKE